MRSTVNITFSTTPYFSNTTQGVNTTQVEMKRQDCILEKGDIVLFIGYCNLFIVGVFGNALVLLIFIPNWRKGPIIELLICYLAFFDLLSSVFGPMLFGYWIVTCNKSWHFGWFGCKLLPALSRIFTDISIGVILVMAIDRCRSIVTPLKLRYQRKTIHAAVAVTLLLSSLSEYYYIHALNYNKTCEVGQVSDPWYSYPLVVFTATRNIAFVVIFSITTIAVYVKLNRAGRNYLLGQNQDIRAEQRRRVMKMLVVMATVFALTVIPRDMLHLAYTISWITPQKTGIHYTHALRYANKALKMLQTSNSIYNVFIYGKMHDHFWGNVKVFVFRRLGARFNYVHSMKDSVMCQKGNSFHKAGHDTCPIRITSLEKTGSLAGSPTEVTRLSQHCL